MVRRGCGGFVEPDAWESVSRMQASADDEVPLSAWPQVGAAALEAPPAVMPLMRLAARFGVSQQNRRQLAERRRWRALGRSPSARRRKPSRSGSAPEEDRVRREEQKRIVVKIEARVKREHDDSTISFHSK
ncbi:hypothetical protein DIPPA_32028 [Diplonema papillatum]|nr:hypothetical protein DIPPA_32028 [Diplonema papillatum]